MSYINSKYHVAINNQGYVISHRSGKHYYQKKRAPSFVNKFGSGDSSYRDATFWQFWVQTNWRNGSKQLKFDDPGKFWKSYNVNTSQQDELTLSRALISAGQIKAGTKVNTFAAWRSSQNWWNASYGYRKQLTISAPAGQSLPTGYPIKITEDTSALQTASKVRSDRKDWRIVYFNGSSWVDLYRDYVDTSITVFSLQAPIAAGASDTNYYIYYGYSGESTTKQPSNDSEWNQAYAIFRQSSSTDPDTYTVGVYHPISDSGSPITDTKTTNDTSYSGGNVTFGTDGKFGRRFTSWGFSDSNCPGYSSSTDVTSFTVEFFASATSWGGIITNVGLDGDGPSVKYKIQVDSNNSVYVEIRTSASDSNNVNSGNDFLLTDGAQHHYAITFDGNTRISFYRDGTLFSQKDKSTPGIRSINARFAMFSNADTAKISHYRYSNAARLSFPYAFTATPTVTAGSELTTQPPSSNFTTYAGLSDGGLYTWDGSTTWTKVYDARYIEKYDSTSEADVNNYIGDDGGTEKAYAMSFQLSATQAKSKIKEIQLYLKKATGTPGNITVRVETNNAGAPSGTLADANATTTISSFTDTSYGWRVASFANSFSLSASTTYWIVAKTSAAANDNNYQWAGDSSSPSYSSGNSASSTDGGSTWSAVTGTDSFFRILGNETSLNKLLITQVGGSQVMLIASGSPTSQENGDARLYKFDGSNYTLGYTFNTATESQVLSIAEYSSGVYAGVGPQGRMYKSTDLTTWTLTKDINTPQNPGYIYAQKEYNSRLYAGGGSPEFLPDKTYNGFVYGYDSTTWFPLYPFDFTIMKSMEFFDAFLFMGTYHGHLFVYDTASLNPLFNFTDLYNYKQQVYDMKYFDDKLYIALYPQDGTSDTNAAIWKFDRHGMSAAHSVSGVTGYRTMDVVNNELLVGTGDDGYVYRLSSTQYVPEGWVQLSYFDANLPSIDKLWDRVIVRHDPLPTGCTVVVYYRFKENDSWTLLGTSSTPTSEEATLQFPSATSSKKITLKVVMTTSDFSKSPRLTEIITRYALSPERKWIWTMRLLAIKNLRLADGTVETRTAGQIRTDLEDSQGLNSLITYKDIDGTEYQVLFNDIDQSSWVVNLDDVNEDEVVVSLIEA